MTAKTPVTGWGGIEPPCAPLNASAMSKPVVPAPMALEGVSTRPSQERYSRHHAIEKRLDHHANLQLEGECEMEPKRAGNPQVLNNACV